MSLGLCEYSQTSKAKQCIHQSIFRLNQSLTQNMTIEQPILIGAFGGSVTYGVLSTKTYCSQLVEAFQKEFPLRKFECLNFGIRATGSDLPALCLKDIVSKVCKKLDARTGNIDCDNLKLDIVIYEFNINGIQLLSKLISRVNNLYGSPIAIYWKHFSLRSNLIKKNASCLGEGYEAFPNLSITMISEASIEDFYNVSVHGDNRLKKSLWPDSRHLSTIGHRMVATYIFRWLISSLENTPFEDVNKEFDCYYESIGSADCFEMEDLVIFGTLDGFKVDHTLGEGKESLYGRNVGSKLKVSYSCPWKASVFPYFFKNGYSDQNGYGPFEVSIDNKPYFTSNETYKKGYKYHTINSPTKIPNLVEEKTSRESHLLKIEVLPAITSDQDGSGQIGIRLSKIVFMSEQNISSGTDHCHFIRN